MCECSKGWGEKKGWTCGREGQRKLKEFKKGANGAKRGWQKGNNESNGSMGRKTIEEDLRGSMDTNEIGQKQVYIKRIKTLVR